MSGRVELLLYVLCVCVRALTFDQTMRLLGVRDAANLRRLLRPLLATGLVNVARVLAKAVPDMQEPLLTYSPQANNPGGEVQFKGAFPRVLYVAARRWRDVPATLSHCVIASRKAGLLYGVPRSGAPAKQLQCSHDLGVSGCFLAQLQTGRIKAEAWHGEDFANFRLGAKTPDAILVGGPMMAPQRAIELVGADYTADKLLAIHRECDARGLAYELW